MPDCNIALVDFHGKAFPVGRRQVLGVQRLPGNRILILSRDLKLWVRDSLGSEAILGESAAVPRVSEDGQRVVFTQFPKGTTQLVPGLIGRLTSLRLASRETHVVTEDPSASSPIPVPGTEDVLFLSSRTGLASIWMASPGKPDRQITNVGLVHVNRAFIPVYGQEWVWIPESRDIVYTASYGSQVLWQLNVDTGKAIRLGFGRLPQWAGSGVVLAFDDHEKSAPRVKRFTPGRLK
jgi:Tol biopolymer transport system component